MEIYGYREKKCQNSGAFKDWNTEAYIWYYMEIGNLSVNSRGLPANDNEPSGLPALYIRNVLNGRSVLNGLNRQNRRSGHNALLRTLRTLQAGRGLK